MIDARRHLHTRNSYQGLDAHRSTLNHLAFEIEATDFDPERERLEALGLEVSCLDFPHMQAKGMFFRDPEENLVELICHHR